MDIKRLLSKEEKQFIKQHGLALSEIYDARGLTSTVYHERAKELGCLWVINSCYKGHRLKTRSGHCIECDPKRIVYQRRYSESGILYIAIAGDHCKVGITENNYNDSNESIYHRSITLNMDDGYGNISGWKIVKYWEVKNAGRIENEVHQLLAEYKEDDVEYWYSGEWRTAKELFKCSQQTAETAVKKVIDDYTL
jgi:hypothetical protein